MTTSRHTRLLRAARRGWRATADDLRDQDDRTVRDANGVQRRLYLPPVEERDRPDLPNRELAGIVTTLRGMSDAELRRLRRRIIVEGALLAGLLCLAPALSFTGRNWVALLPLVSAGFIVYGTVWRWRMATPYRFRPRLNQWEAPKGEVVQALLRHNRCPSCGQSLAGLSPSAEGRLVCRSAGERGGATVRRSDDGARNNSAAASHWLNRTGQPPEPAGSRRSIRATPSDPHPPPCAHR